MRKSITIALTMILINANKWPIQICNLVLTKDFIWGLTSCHHIIIIVYQMNSKRGGVFIYSIFTIVYIILCIL